MSAGNTSILSFFSEPQIKVCCPAPLRSLFSIVVLLKVECACKSQGEAGEKQIQSQSVWPGLRGVPRWCRYCWSQNHTVSTRLYSSLFTFLGGCTGSQGCHNQEPQPGWLRTTEICCPTDLEGGRPKWRCLQGRTPSKNYRGILSCSSLFLASGGLLAVFSILWLVDASLHSHGSLLPVSSCCLLPLCVYLCIQISPLKKHTSHIGLKPTLTTSS